MKPNVIARLKIANYRGIEFLDTASQFPNGIPAAGILIKGPNAAGKTSVLNAILAALSGRDIKADAIRTGADRFDILVDMSSISVARSQTMKTSKLVVTDHETGKPVKAPSDWLTSMIGASLDPLEFMRMKLKDQKEYVLSAIPIEVTPSDVTSWLEGWALSPDLELDYSLHGLEIVSAIRRDFYERRTEKNAEVKAYDKDQAALEAGAPPAPATAMSVADADAAAVRASGVVSDLRGRIERVTAYAAKTQATRDRAAKMRADAAELDAKPHPDTAADDVRARAISASQASLDRYTESITASEEEIAKLQGQIVALQEGIALDRQASAKVRLEIEKARGEERAHEAAVEARARDAERAEALRVQANELEAAIAATSETEPTPEESAEALAGQEAAAKAQADARALALRREHDAKVAAVATKRSEAEVEASKLDAMVTKFAKEIPSHLLAKSNGIPGLSIDDDEITLDDVRFSKLSGRERLLFCVRLARRLNTRAKILVTDGLEVVDPEFLPEFIAEATADGYQLIATRVEAGDVTFEAIGV